MTSPWPCLHSPCCPNLRLFTFGDFGVVRGLGGFHLGLGLFDCLLPLFVELRLLAIGFSLTLGLFCRALRRRRLRDFVRLDPSLVCHPLALRFLVRLPASDRRLPGELLGLQLLLLFHPLDRR